MARRNKISPAAARRAARLAAVQALYQLDINEPDPPQVVAEFITHHLSEHADRAMFAALVTGVADRVTDLDRMIGEALAEGWAVERLELVLRAILRAGCFELLNNSEVPARVVINEYLDLAHAFFSEREPALVNGVLDRLAKILRAGEFMPATGTESA